MDEKLLKALEDLEKAWITISENWDDRLEGCYPFAKDFDEMYWSLAIWIERARELNKEDRKND